MSLPAVSLVLLLSLASFVVAQETPKENTNSGNVTYWITFPSHMRRGVPVPVSAQLLVPGATSTVHVTLCNSTDGQVFSSAEPQVVTGGNSPTIISLMIPRDLRIPDENDYSYWSYSRQFEVRVVATGDVTFNRSGDMILEDKSFSIFVQTDKAMYKPGDTIRLRILAMNPDLTVMNEAMDVLMKDPLYNVIRQWKSVSGGNTGVVELSMPTSDRLTLGDWTIEAKVLGVKQTKTFTVAEYVLPKYEAKVDVPANVLSTDPVRGTASAKYTFGKPLVGAKVEVTAKFKYYWYEAPQPNITISGILDSKGEFPFTLTNGYLIGLLNETYPYRSTWSVLSLDYDILQIIVNITDPATGRQMGADADVQFSKFLAKVEFLPVSSSNFKPGLLYTAYLQVTRYDGTNFANPESITVDFQVTVWRPNNTATTTASPTTTTTTQSTTAETNANETLIEEPPIEIIRRPGFWGPVYWEPEYSEQYKETRTLTANGFLSLDVTLPEDAKRVDIEATVMNATGYTSASRSNSPSDNFLQLLLTSRNPKVGQTVEFTARTTEPVKHIIYQVYAKGTMVFESEVASSVETGSQTFSISFTLTALMAPNCRIVAFYFRDNGEVVPDSMSVSVQGTSDNPVNVTFSVQTAKPGDTVNLVISAKPNTTIFLLSVDKSVQLLKSGNDITQETVTEELVSYDYGSGFYGFWRYMYICGWPYPSRGSDASQVFNDANVIILTDGLVYQKPFERYPNFIVAPSARGGIAEFASAPVSSDLAVERIRKNFPETWLWSMVIVGMINDVRSDVPWKNLLQKSIPEKDGSRELFLKTKDAFASEPAPEAQSITTSEPVARVRKNFPETWLFKTVIISSSGIHIQPEIAPDTITTWLTTAIAVHPLYGLSVTPKAAEMTTILKLFLSLNMPYSAIRGEDICLKAFAFNYYDIPLRMTMRMGRTDGIQAILLQRNNKKPKGAEEVRRSISVSHYLGKVDPDTVSDTDFCFTPVKLGSLPIRVNLTTTSVPGDGVEQMLLVKPEGTPKSEAESVILDVRPGVLFSHIVNITFPSGVVQGSQHISVAIAGDLLGPVMENIDDLLRMPYGCGEQNMIYFAPNVFIILYLKRTNTYTPELAAKAQDYMLKGYQRELTYQHKDGSYSAFGESGGKSGSMWLTAFVVKCFAQSTHLGSDIIVIDPKVIKISITWITSIQNKNGSFPEPGVVFSKSLQGGSGTGVALTAYVMITLMEALRSPLNLDTDGVVSSSIAQAQLYLENELNQLSDSYELAIVTYALHLANSPQKDAALRLLEQRAITESLTTHWERPKPAVQQPYYSWQRDTDAVNVEMTSYGLLTYQLRNDISKCLPIVRWLTSQRGSQGGFISTQDTVIALQALSNMAAVLFSPTSAPVTVTVGWTSGGRRHRANVTIDDSTRILLQQVEIPITGNDIPSSVEIQARTNGNFSGIAVAAVNLNYNVGSRTDSNTFNLNYRVELIDEKSFILTVEFSRIDSKVGGMTLVSVGVPTGYSLDKESPDYSVIGSQKEEEGDQKVTYYYEELGPETRTLVLPMIETNGIIVKIKEIPITISDYYYPDNQKTVYYVPKDTQTTSVCDRVENYQNCFFLKNKPKK